MGGGIAMDHLIVVSGASGAGKSSFLDQLASGELPQSIRDRLPDGAGAWTRVHALDHPRWLPPLDDDRAEFVEPGLVLHYDLTRRWDPAIGAFATDPALRILHRARSVTIVHIRPDHDRLLRQWALGKTEFGNPRYLRFWPLLDRLARLAWPARPWIRMLRKRLQWPGTRPARRLLRRIERSLVGWRMPSSDALAAYLQPDGADKVEALYREWEDFIDRFQEDNRAIDQIHVRPAPDGPVGSHGRWAIVAS